MKISVVIPVYNEVETIKEIVGRVQAVEFEKEIIIVDDYSTDGTREHLREINQAHENVAVLYHDHNQGKGVALRTGFQAVTGDVVIIQDVTFNLLDIYLGESSFCQHFQRFLLAPYGAESRAVQRQRDGHAV